MAGFGDRLRVRDEGGIVVKLHMKIGALGFPFYVRRGTKK